MTLTYNGKKVSVADTGVIIRRTLTNISTELFRKYVENFVKNLSQSRRKARKAVKDFLKNKAGQDLYGSVLPDMNSGKMHGNLRKYNMLENIVFDRIPPKVRIGKRKAKIMLTYGIDTDGSDNLVKNKKGVAYAQILDKWNGESKNRSVPSIRRFNGFIGGIREYYRGMLMQQLVLDMDKQFGKINDIPNYKF